MNETAINFAKAIQRFNRKTELVEFERTDNTRYKAIYLPRQAIESLARELGVDESSESSPSMRDIPQHEEVYQAVSDYHGVVFWDGVIYEEGDDGEYLLYEDVTEERESLPGYQGIPFWDDLDPEVCED